MYSPKVIGIGSPIMDLLAHVSDEHLEHVAGAKGGMELVDHAVMTAHLSRLPQSPQLAPGGSAANTIFSLAHLGMETSILGMLGRDEHGDAYREAFEKRGGDVSRFKYSHTDPTALCLSMITPDSQRTMRTYLGAAASLSPQDVAPEDFIGYAHAHIEGYLLFNRDLMMAVLTAAKAAGCTISLSMGSFEVVNAARDILPGILDTFVDMVFANEDEARAFGETADLDDALDIFAQHCNTVAVTLGPDGALISHDGEYHKAEGITAANVIDTTGAGDCWAAGFLYGLLNDHGHERAAWLGALMGSKAVQETGAALGDAAMAEVKAALAQGVKENEGAVV